MTEPNAMTVWPETWAVAVDRTGLYLADGEQPWTSETPLPRTVDVEAAVDQLLDEHDAFKNTVAVQSPRLRFDERGLALTHLAIIRVAVSVKGEWPAAVPVDTTMDPDLLDELRKVGVLLTADPVFAGLLEQTQSGSPGHWRRHLTALFSATDRHRFAA